MMAPYFLVVTFLSLLHTLPTECLDGFKYFELDPSLQEKPSSPSQFQINGVQRRKRAGYKPATCTCTCETKVLKNRQPFDERIVRNHEDQHFNVAGKPIFDGNHHFLDEAYQDNNANNPVVLDGFEKFSWQQLPDTDCYRRPCNHDGDCCKRFHSCDKSARVCVDCWRGFSCKIDDDCCFKYPRCEVKSGNKVGKCVDD